MSIFLFGKDGVLYHSATALDGATNTAGSVTWDEYDNVQDVSGNFAGTTVSTTTRATAKTGWESQETVLNSGEISFTMPQLDPATASVGQKTVFDAIVAAWLGKTTVTMMSLTGPEDVEDNQGLAANFSVEMSQGMPVADVQTWDVTLAVSSFPEWYVVPAGP